MHEGVWFRKKYFLTKWQLWELRQFSLLRLLYMHRWCLHGSINSYHSFWWNNLRLCLYNLNTLNIGMHEGVWFRKNNFWRNDSCENLDNFSPIRLLYMHRWCLHGPINSYYSFWWNNLLPQLLMEQFETWPIQFKHIEHRYAWRSFVQKK